MQRIFLTIGKILYWLMLPLLGLAWIGAVIYEQAMADSQDNPGRG